MRLLNALPLLLLVALPAGADTVHLKDGGAFEGKVVSGEDGAILRVALRNGSVEIPRDRVARIERGPCAWEAYAERLKSLDAKSVKAQMEMAAWCRGKGLEPEASSHAEAALALDPKCAEARRFLAPPPAACPDSGTDGEEEEDEEVAQRPVERFGGMSASLRTSSPRRASGSCPASWTYPVRAGSVWYTSWGTVYGPPLVLWGWGWDGRPCTVTSTPTSWSTPCVP